MTEPVAKTLPCTKCKELVPPGVNPCPACGSWQRKFSLRTVAHSLTVGKRPEDKTVRKTTAAVGGSGAIVALFFQAISAYQGEAKAWRELSQKQGEATTLALTRQADATVGLQLAIEKQSEVLREVATATRDTVTAIAVKKAQAPIQPVAVEAKPVRRR